MTIEELFEAERGPLERRLTRMLGSTMAAEDVAQEALLCTWRRAPAMLDPRRRVAWLHRTATNLAIDELRRRRFTSDLDPDELQLEATAEDTAEVLAAREALSRLLRMSGWSSSCGSISASPMPRSVPSSTCPATRLASAAIGRGVT